MKTLLIIICFLSCVETIKSQTINNIENSLKNKSVIIFPNDQIYSYDYFRISRAEGNTNVSLINSKFIGAERGVFKQNIDNPNPGLNTIPGTLTNVKTYGDNTYLVTCIASSDICLIYFLKY